MNFAIYLSPFGHMRIDYENDAVTRLQKLPYAPQDCGQATPFSDRVFSELCEYFDGKRKGFSFALSAAGTDFQKRVWQALCDIPYGQTRTYKEIAAAVGNDKASRAVGMANNKNPIQIVVPCHRVIGANGALIGYAGGLDMKEKLLQLERTHA